MQTGEFKTLMDLYEWLPPYGETSISTRFDGNELSVDVVYDDEDSSSERSKTIRFTGVCSFMISLIPGVNLSALIFENIPQSGHLVEYENSEAAKAWTEYLKYRQVRHYRVYFSSENRFLEVFAGSWQI